MWDETIRAEGRALVFSYRFKRPMDMDANRWDGLEKIMRDGYCADDCWLLRSLKATETHAYYGLGGERLKSFSITPADCPQW